MINFVMHPTCCAVIYIRWFACPCTMEPFEHSCISDKVQKQDIEKAAWGPFNTRGTIIVNYHVANSEKCVLLLCMWKLTFVRLHIQYTCLHTHYRYIKTSGSESRPRKVELASAHKKTRRLPRVFYT